MNAVYAIEWTEYERGWGQRPDGTSYHKTLELAKDYISAFWKGMPDGPAPECYSKPSEPKLIEVSSEIYEQVQNKKMTWK